MSTITSKFTLTLQTASMNGVRRERANFSCFCSAFNKKQLRFYYQMATHALYPQFLNPWGFSLHFTDTRRFSTYGSLSSHIFFNLSHSLSAFTHNGLINCVWNIWRSTLADDWFIFVWTLTAHNMRGWKILESLKIKKNHQVKIVFWWIEKYY